MNEEMKIEELLNSFVDGELSVRQRTEVKRMAANDPNIAVRLRQIQKCRTLVSALPIAQAPSCIMENVKSAMETKIRESEKEPVSISDYRPAKTGLFLFRRVFAAAAMLTLAAVLVVVINMITPSHISEPPVQAAANMRFSGKLELKTIDLKAFDSVISKAIKNSGFAGSTDSIRELSRYVYNLNCSKEGMNKILTELEEDWDKLYSAKLFVDTKDFGGKVEIAAVTPSQIDEIVNQKDADNSIQVARDFSVKNSVNELIYDNTIFQSGGGYSSGLFRITMPVEVREYPTAQQENGEKTVNLRIILSR